MGAATGRALVRPLMIVALCMGACDSGAPREPLTSAEVEAPPLARWELAASPDFLVSGGVLNGDSAHFVFVLTGAFLPGGDAVVSGSDGRVVFIDSLGSFRNVLGGPGEGPQEFRAAPFIVRSGENLLLVEHGAGRVRNLWSTGFGDPRPYVPAGRQHTMVAAFDDGVVVSAPLGLLIGRSESDFTTWHPVTPLFLEAGATVDTVLGPPSPPLPGFPYYMQNAFCRDSHRADRDVFQRSTSVSGMEGCSS